MPTRIAVIDRTLCIREKCGYLCAKVCPVNRMQQECVTIEKESSFPVISEALCIGCGLCVKKCPVSCISVINLAEEAGTPIFQYGVNTFRLYGLPLPKKGAVSLLGKNGIGKTTGLLLLSRQLKPNFGDPTKKINEEEMLNRMPTEMRHYFSQSPKELKIVHKPQYVDRIKKVFNGTVVELLEKSNRNIQEVVELFGLSEILNRKISQLSGGELQKVAMAAVYARAADIYYFDEFTNYLDIEERLKSAVLLKQLAEEKSLVIAEHDLSILDYVSDYVYIFYGDENVYGVVSRIKNVRTGINEYIRGFLKEENVRFRSYELEFSRHSEPELNTSVKIEYPEMIKKFDGFSFSSKPGAIRNGEILGIVGKNALGKSLFIKMLAGIEKPDNVEGQLQLSLSYKPQYLEEIASKDVQVRELLKDGLSAVLDEAKRRFGIRKLMEKRTGELSGGELQRVAITAALAKDADVYLFDEPSAFLDIEQRFEFAALLRRTISERGSCAFVVDHDIIFIDAIANRLLVFEGKSSVHGHTDSPLNKRDGMNRFLKCVGITMRRDKDTNRPRINKPDSGLDREQKEKMEYYYSF